MAVCEVSELNIKKATPCCVTKSAGYDLNGTPERVGGIPTNEYLESAKLSIRRIRIKHFLEKSTPDDKVCVSVILTVGPYYLWRRILQQEQHIALCPT